jgi:hypothetical protein
LTGAGRRRRRRETTAEARKSHASLSSGGKSSGGRALRKSWDAFVHGPGAGRPHRHRRRERTRRTPGTPRRRGRSGPIDAESTSTIRRQLAGNAHLSRKRALLRSVHADSAHEADADGERPPRSSDQSAWLRHGASSGCRRTRGHTVVASDDCRIPTAECGNAAFLRGKLSDNGKV